jgi:hypothetical protein
MMRGWIEITVRDKHGRVIQHGKHEMRSFVNNFLRVFEGFANGSSSVVKEDGSTGTFWGYRSYSDAAYPYTLFDVAGDAGDATLGIIVGSGITSFNLNQNALASKIAHGSGAGQLNYNVTSIDDLGLNTVVSPPVYQIRISRTFYNASSSAVTINEVGILARNKGDDIRFLIVRDVLPTSYSVPAGGSAGVVITMEVEMG